MGFVPTCPQDVNGKESSMNRPLGNAGKISAVIVFLMIAVGCCTYRSPDRPVLELDLKLSTDVLVVNKMPGLVPPQGPEMQLTLVVTWPYRSIWKGTCPTSQLYDFSIEYKGETIWKWSEQMAFSQVITFVEIPGGSSRTYTEVWKVDPADIESEGTYTARAIFIASGQEVKKDFEIKFVY